jgi:arylsulfatase A-like enzyme
LPFLTGQEKAGPHDALYWRFGEQWAVRQGDWKLVASRADAFEPQLFNLADDKQEVHNLIAERPEKADELKAAWNSWNADNIPAKWKPRPQQQRNGQRQARRQAATATSVTGGAAVAAQ